MASAAVKVEPGANFPRGDIRNFFPPKAEPVKPEIAQDKKLSVEDLKKLLAPSAPSSSTGTGSGNMEDVIKGLMDHIQQLEAKLKVTGAVKDFGRGAVFPPASTPEGHHYFLVPKSCSRGSIEESICAGKSATIELLKNGVDFTSAEIKKFSDLEECLAYFFAHNKNRTKIEIRR